MADWTLLPGDCRHSMRLCLAPDSVDSIVTDPPYDLTSIVKRFGGPNAAPCQPGTDGAFARASRGFMNMTWDGSGVAFDPDTWREAWRVLKPGGHLIAFGGSRTYHRLACAIEDAGFEIRDQIMWLYGSGFPKSHDVSKGIDKAAGAERDRTDAPRNGQQDAVFSGKGGARCIICGNSRNGTSCHCPLPPPATDAARQWEGWGTALKPAHEPIVLARKPLVGTVAANVLAHGTGALNIDGCRVEHGGTHGSASSAGLGAGRETANLGAPAYGDGLGGIVAPPHALGRFPANVMHDGSDEVLAGFPESNGGHHPKVRGVGGIGNDGHAGQSGLDERSDRETGSAARFFYTAKASKADREEGCERMPLQVADTVHKIPRSELDDPRRAGTVPRRNHHPTVKPTALMRYLCRLVTPPGGTVLDPFTGSGSTGKAALLEGFSFIGCEMTAEYIPIAEARLAHALAQSKETPGAG